MCVCVCRAALVCDLRALGLASEADRLHQEVAARQEGTERALRTAAEFGTPDELAVSYTQN